MAETPWRPIDVNRGEIYMSMPYEDSLPSEPIIRATHHNETSIPRTFEVRPIDGEITIAFEMPANSHGTVEIPEGERPSSHADIGLKTRQT
jgi:hypothetical protein